MFINNLIVMYDEYKVYKVYHKREWRYMACLVNKQERHTISWARYLLSCHLWRILKSQEHVDHINWDKSDDRIENLQILSPWDNIRKMIFETWKYSQATELVCILCWKIFYRLKQRTKKYKQCCSRVCWWKQSHITKGSVTQWLE